MEVYYKAQSDDDENTSDSNEDPKEPKPVTESSGEIIKPGGKDEKNPKKMG